MQKGAIYSLLFPLAQFHLGVAITPTKASLVAPTATARSE